MKKLFFILLTFACANISFADPTYDATRGALQNNSALCGYGYNPSCNSGSMSPRKIIQYVDVHVPSKYGAYAINNKTRDGWGVLNRDSLTEAKKDALRECKVHSNNNASCKIVAWVRNGCIAASKGRSGRNWEGFYVAGERGKAESRALKKCSDKGLTDCQIILPEGCSLPDGM